MKKLLFGSVVVAVLSVAGLGRAYAQDASVVKVPFPFVVGAKLLPAGEYRVVPAMAGESVIVVESVNGAASSRVAVVPDGPVALGANPTFTFRAFQKRYFLAEISTPEAPAYRVPLATKDVDRVLAKLDLSDFRGDAAVHQH